MIDEEPGTAKIRRSKKKKQSVDRVKTSSWQVGEKNGKISESTFHVQAICHVQLEWEG